MLIGWFQNGRAGAGSKQERTGGAALWAERRAAVVQVGCGLKQQHWLHWPVQ